jgi:hypothetical protein
VHFGLIDAVVSGHGEAGGRRPIPIRTGAVVVAIVQDTQATAEVLLDQALALADFRGRASVRIAEAIAARGACTAIVVPALDAYAADSPAAANAALVERLLDVLFDLGVTEASVGSTRGTAALWLENRDVFVAADLLGYRYETPGGRPYDVLDLADDAEPGAFPEWGPLSGAALSRAWRAADLRLVFSANRTDDDEGYALCLSTLLSVLPQTDKDYHYRYRRDVGEVVAQLLSATPVHFGLIDAVVSGHGEAGGRRPIPIRTGAVVVATDPALADYVGAAKMALDPYISALAAPSLRALRGRPDLQILGSIEPYRDWVNVSAALVASTAVRRGFVSADRALRPALQHVDRDLFPFRHPANDWLNRTVADMASAGEAGAEGAGVLSFLNLSIGEMEKAGSVWGVMFDKDALRQSEAGLNIDPAAVPARAYQTLPAELGFQAELLRGVAADAEGIRWRFDDGAVLFDGARRFPIPFDAFVDAVPIHRAIQFMNDYAGGSTYVTRRDKRGRVLRQIERNLYLPQPNYTAVGGGVTIDVTKIEVVEYTPQRQRMYWKTVKSENGSAIADDGIVSFEALGADTLVTIWGRQHFVLPPLWAAIDRQLTPSMKKTLISDAYGRFFQRTFANLEAVAEGRNVRIGRPWSDASEGEPLPVERVTEAVRRLTPAGGFDLSALVKTMLGRDRQSQLQPDHIDADGFRHFHGASPMSADSPVASALSGVLRDLRHAARIDAGGEA